MDEHDRRVIEVLYADEAGDLARYRILPIRIFFGRTPSQEQEQWVLEAQEAESQTDRVFALKDIQAWLPHELQTAPF